MVETEVIEKLEITAPDFAFPEYDDKSVKEILCTGVFEYVPGKLRGKFMDEVYRILTDDGKAVFNVPYWNTWRGCYDARFEWPPFCEQSFLCYNKSWREANMKGLELVCDFDFTYGYAAEPETAARSEESRAFYIKHYTNCVDALQLTLTKRNA